MFELVYLWLLHVVLTALPGVAVTLVAARRGVRSVPVLLLVGLAAGGVLAMLTFWAYYLAPVAGKVVSLSVAAVALGTVTSLLVERRFEPGLLRALATPFALWALGSGFLLFYGFLHGGLPDHALSTAATRFSPPSLPSDNDIPRYYTEWFYAHGHSGHPPLYGANWLVSDRPPLQIGYMLLQRPFVWDPGPAFNYQIVGVLLQQLWIVAAWALLLAARVGRLTRALCAMALLLSYTTIVNGFFVWPKLLPGAMLLGASALVLTPLWAEGRRSLRVAALAGVLLALAMLGHGASFFGIVPLALVALFRGRPGWRWIAVAVAAAAVLMLPWSAYQKYVAPPGNRLTKEALAGLPNGDRNSTLHDVIDAYRAAGVGGALHNKGQNFVQIVGGGPMIQSISDAARALGRGQPDAALADIRPVFFFDLWPSLGLLAFAPLLMAAGWRRPAEGRFASLTLITVVVGSLAWGLIMFGNESSHSVIHQGSYLIPLLLTCAMVVGARASFPRAGAWLIAVNCLLMLAITAPDLASSPSAGYDAGAVALASACLVGFAAAALSGVRPGKLSSGGTQAADCQPSTF